MFEDEGKLAGLLTAAPQEVAVIIPYYQIKAGILARGLASVFRQKNCPPLRIIVVDDASPAPVEPELAGLDPAARACIEVIKQPNLGPGPARNTGLVAVPYTATYIAFLDSDDIWQEDHLSRATGALAQGIDFYFTDGNAEGAPSGLFHAIGFESSMHECIDRSRQIYRFRGDFLALLLRQTPVITSSVVMRREKLGALRFPAWHGICEDLIYWIQIAQADPKIGFSPNIEITGGREGVHISHRGEWNTNKSLMMINDYVHYYCFILKTVQLSDEQQEYIQERAKGKCIDFLATALAMLKAGQIPDFRLACAFLFKNPQTVCYLAKYLRRVAGRSGRTR